MIELANTYLRVPEVYYDPEEFNRAAIAFEEISVKAARDFFGGEIRLKTEVEEGSLAAWATVIGLAIGGIYTGVAQYPEFREGVIEACENGGSFSNAICDAFGAHVGAGKKIYKQNRASTPKRILRTIEKAEALGKMEGKLDEKENNLRIQEVVWELAELRKTVKDDQVMRDVLRNLSRSNLQSIPMKLDALDSAIRPRKDVAYSKARSAGKLSSDQNDLLADRQEIQRLAKRKKLRRTNIFDLD